MKIKEFMQIKFNYFLEKMIQMNNMNMKIKFPNNIMMRMIH